MDIDNSRASFSPGKKFQLDIYRDTLNAIFEVAHDMEKVKRNSSEKKFN